MRLSDLQEKDIVNINDGRKVGKIVDADITLDGKINYLIVDFKKGIRSFINSYMEANISFEQIKKIGSDVILVDLWYNTKDEGYTWIKRL